MPIKKAKQINLIPQDNFETSDFGRILKWALGSFRVMVIVTELIVMSAFLSRFWLDSRNSDLNDEIDVAQSQILAYQDIEDEFRSLQKRTSLAKSIYGETKVTTIINDIVGLMPETISLSSLSNSEDEITIKATSFSEQSIAEFLVNLDKSKNLGNINLTQVNSNIDNQAGTSFTITANLKSEIERGLN